MKQGIERAVTPVESIFSLSPFSVVAMLFRINGDVDKTGFENALSSARHKHPVLNSVIKIDSRGEKVFAPALSEELDIGYLERRSDEQWKDIYSEQCASPFEFEKRPAVRFFLLHSGEVSELMIFSHHIICDGLSLAYLGRDLLEFMGNKSASEPELMEPVPAGSGNLPPKLKVSGFIKSVLVKMNTRFMADREYFDFDDYKELHSAYWKRFSHEMVSMTLSEEDTVGIIEACRNKRVSVNSAISTAICGARQTVMGNDGVPNKHSIAVSLRERLPLQPGEGMGFFAGSAELPFIYNEKKDFWNNTVRFHKRMLKKLDNKNVFRNILNWSHLEPGIMESMNFKILGSLTEQQGKINNYSKKQDLVASLVRREKMDSTDNMMLATAVTNLGNLKFERAYGKLELDSVVMNPGGAFPLAMVQLVAAVSTVSGKLCILLEYEKGRMSPRQAQTIMDLTLRYLKS